MPDRFYTPADKYRYGFNGMEKDDEVKGNDNSYDFGARMYDPRVGRWFSVDPLAAKYPGWSPYNFAMNNPILFVDPDGEEGTIYIQVMLDDQGEPVIDKKTMEDVKERMIKEYQEKMGVELDVEIVYTNEILSKDKFESRDGAHESDSYVIIGSGDGVNSAQWQANDLGWANDWNSLGSSTNGTSNGTDRISVVNADNIKKINGEAVGETIGQFSSVSEKTAITVMHETGHPKFKGHPENDNGVVRTNKVNGHVPGTIMQEYPKGDSQHDDYMKSTLRKEHGSTKGYKAQQKRSQQKYGDQKHKNDE